MGSPKQISIAIIGGGPGGLGTAIALSELPYVSVKLYEQAPEPREVGAGITISRNGWNVLRLLGAADGVKGAKQGHSWQRCVSFTVLSKHAPGLIFNLRMDQEWKNRRACDSTSRFVRN